MALVENGVFPNEALANLDQAPKNQRGLNHGEREKELSNSGKDDSQQGSQHNGDSIIHVACPVTL